MAVCVVGTNASRNGLVNDCPTMTIPVAPLTPRAMRMATRAGLP